MQRVALHGAMGPGRDIFQPSAVASPPGTARRTASNHQELQRSATPLGDGRSSAARRAVLGVPPERCRWRTWWACDQWIVEILVVALEVAMLDELADRVAKVALSERNQLVSIARS
jgi:hypothetical protein